MNELRKIALQLNQDTIRLLKHVHVNMPWAYMPGRMETIVDFHINLEIGFDAAALEGASCSTLGSVAKRLSEGGCKVTFHGPFWDLNPGSVDPMVRQCSRYRLQQLFDAVDVFHPLQVVCHTGFDPRHHTGHRRLWIENSLSVWEPLVKRAETLKIPLLLENVWENDPGLHSELFERIDSPYFGFCLDVGHQNCFSTTPSRVWLEALSDRMRELHLHDNDANKDAHLPIGQGSVDFKGLFSFLSSKEQMPLFTIEPHTEEHLAQSLAGLLEVADHFFQG